MEDYCDGEAFASHPVFSVHNDALQIFLYFDELEVVIQVENSQAGYALTVYLYMLTLVIL